jgi:hypothetical protein
VKNRTGITPWRDSIEIASSGILFAKTRLAGDWQRNLADALVFDIFAYFNLNNCYFSIDKLYMGAGRASARAPAEL